MKRASIWFFPLLATLLILLAACVGTTATPTPEVPQIILTYYGPNGPEYLTLEALKTLPATEAMGGIISSTGQITIPELYKGVALRDLVAAFGGIFDSSMGMTLTAEDGYSMTYSYEQVMNGEFPAYDPANGTELTDHDPLTAILAYERNGQPLDPVQDGTLRLVIVSERNNQVTDGHWSIKWVNKVQVDTVSQTWTLDMEGAILSSIDRGSYQSCSAPACHGVEWQDENGQIWWGVPVWLLVGEVDDADSHSDYAYNDELADAGYTVDVVGRYGYVVTLDSLNIKRNGNLIIAYLVNNSELPDDYYPLRLVGTGLQNSQMVGQIARIIVHVPEVPAPTPAASVDVTGDLIITGLVNQPLGLMDADLHASNEVITITAEHPKNGIQEFTGLRFECLFNMSGLKPNASTVVLTASDGFSSEVNLEDLQNCEDCMLAFTDTPGVYNAVMPGFTSNFWAKNVVTIEVK